MTVVDALLAAQVPPNYRFAAAPLHLSSTVVIGFGRGSKQLGVPTANMDPAPLEQQLQQLPQGVYFGWAQLDPPQGSPAADAAVYKMVMNVGRRPTVNPGGLQQVYCGDCMVLDKVHSSSSSRAARLLVEALQLEGHNQCFSTGSKSHAEPAFIADASCLYLSCCCCCCQVMRVLP